MQQVISSERKPIKMWLDDLEEGALQQAKNVANLPFIFKHITILPDSHLGFGLPIGTVVATENVAIISAVGVDIGCGLQSVKTSLTEITTEQLKELMGKIRQVIPVGMKHHVSDSPSIFVKNFVADLINKFAKRHEVSRQLGSIAKQAGTLGGGNHFIEIQKGSDNHIYIMLHSGSRNLGFKVANHYNTIAKELNQKWHSSVPPEWDLAFLPLDTEEGVDYMKEMKACVEFAHVNRSVMMHNIKQLMAEMFKDITFDYATDIAHNYASMENHFGENVLVHRKGATRAYLGLKGIIPGSQGTNSYIVEGKGNVDSFKSCSHGAGRVLGRKQAKKVLNLAEEITRLDSQGIIHNIRNQDDLDEASGAYKDIHTVMANQQDLVDIIVELHPLAVIKG